MVLFEAIHAFHQLSLIGVFGRKRAYPYLEKYKLQEGFLSNTDYFLTGKQCAHCCIF
jgi:hypothetical protein